MESIFSVHPFLHPFLVHLFQLVWLLLFAVSAFSMNIGFHILFINWI